MCGSTAVDTALKIALAYHKACGNEEKVRFIGRERGYHGVGFGGVGVGGIPLNRKAFTGVFKVVQRYYTSIIVVIFSRKYVAISGPHRSHALFT